MKIKLIFITFLTAFSLSAQTTYQIMWKIGTSGAAADLTIETGDTVEWIWDDTLPHTVSTITGSVETFDSGAITGLGMIYSKTFSIVGDNPYECIFHPGSMNGVITVTEDLGLTEEGLNTFSVLPNPASSIITIKLPSPSNVTEIEIYNILGKRVLGKSLSNTTETPIQIYDWQPGVYIIRITSGENVQSKRFIKL